MSYSFEEFCEIESAVIRTSHAMRQLGADDVAQNLRKAEHMMAELRHAASTLCDSRQASNHADALSRLRFLFGQGAAASILNLATTKGN